MGCRQLIHLLLAVAMTGPALAGECAVDQVEIRGDWGQARFSVEVADEPDERALGLMNRPSMPSGHGMLFIYERPQRAVFWMRNTLIPLDMIFMDESGTVTAIHEGAIPLDETGIDGGDGVLAVLEVNAGVVDLFGIDVGSQLRHPQMAAEIAAWPCG